jgi:hypothetical protein
MNRAHNGDQDNFLKKDKRRNLEGPNDTAADAEHGLREKQTNNKEKYASVLNEATFVMGHATLVCVCK